MATTAARARRRRALDRLVRRHHIEFAGLLADEARKDEQRRQEQMRQRAPFFSIDDELHVDSSNGVVPDLAAQRARLAEVRAIVANALRVVGF